MVLIPFINRQKQSNIFFFFFLFRYFYRSVLVVHVCYLLFCFVSECFIFLFLFCNFPVIGYVFMVLILYFAPFDKQYMHFFNWICFIYFRVFHWLWGLFSFYPLSVHSLSLFPSVSLIPLFRLDCAQQNYSLVYSTVAQCLAPVCWPTESDSFPVV